MIGEFGMSKLLSRLTPLVAGAFVVCSAATMANADGYKTATIGAPAFTWTGFYLGANGGYGFSDSQTVHVNETNFSNPFFNGNFGSLSFDGGFGGVQGGANLQTGPWVVGFEVDLEAADITGTTRSTVTPYVSSGNAITVGTRNTINGFGTFRPRVGFAWDKSLLYATGGLAWADVAHTLVMSDTFGSTATDKNTGIQVGYVVGAGIEHMCTPRLSLKLEYQYIDLGSQNHATLETFGTSPTNFSVATDTRTDFHTVRLGLNYELR
jgi:outer membrane immunogenic protein